jgi:hydroxymethylpyrimidine/phosphomethylpyrimidine kinase
MPPASSPATPPVVLCFAFNDPTGAGGSLGVALSVAASGAHPACALTGFAARDTRGLESVWAIDPEMVDEQARTLLEDLPVAAFHVGALADARAVAVVAAIVSDYPKLPIVLDPDFGNGGDDSVDEDLLDSMLDLLLPQCALLVLSSHDVRHITTQPGEDAASLADCARQLLDSGCGHILITGAHEPTRQIINTLYGPHGVVRTDAWERLPGSFLGAGTTLSAAICARLARGVDLSEAVRDAQAYTWQTLAHSLRVGMGQSIPQRLPPSQT